MDDKIKTHYTNLVVVALGEVLKIEPKEIDSSAQLDKYGIDSVTVLQWTSVLERTFSDINSTVIFEHQTVDSLVEYLLVHYKHILPASSVESGIEPDKSPASQPTTHESGVPYRRSRSRLQRRKELKQSDQSSQADVPASKPTQSDVAIVGLAGRYPHADTLEQFWMTLKLGKSAITEVPAERWDWRDYHTEHRGEVGKIYTRWGGFIADFDKFDPLFFEISPKEAALMDPQERLFLQTAYHCIEDAGYTPETLSDSRRVGVYVGVMNGNYSTGAAYWSVANRVSYIMNFQGPSIAIDSACSSSLTAVHLAAESIASGACDVAIAGGVNLIISPIHYIKLSAVTMLSSHGESRSFGEGADGFVDGEGVGAIILKPLQQAKSDVDNIYGVIKASGINAGGKTNGYSVPSPVSHRKLIAETIAKSGLGAHSISYVEAHGTGTELGDPIEIAGLTGAFRESTGQQQFCAIGSVKSNIGHLESAAGIAGLTKILLQFKYQHLVPSLNSSTLNPKINFGETPFVVQQKLQEWQRPVIDGIEFPLRAGISSFGAGGANAHMIIEEFNEYRPAQDIHEPVIVLLSARDQTRLYEQAQRLLLALENGDYSDNDLINIAYTLQVGRVAMRERMAMQISSLNELTCKLQEFLDNNLKNVYRSNVKASQSKASAKREAGAEQRLAGWVQNRQFSEIIELWLKGGAVDWQLLYQNHTPQRISLPTYPFAKESYWVGSIVDSSATAALSDTAPARPAANSSHFGTDEQPLEYKEQYAKPQKIDDAQVLLKMTSLLKELLSSLTHVQVACIESEAPLQAYGIDSVMIRQLGQELEQLFGVVSKTIFFEYQSIEALAGFFAENHKQRVIDLYFQDETGRQTIHNANSSVLNANATEQQGLRVVQTAKKEMKSNATAPASNSLDVAIIGVSGTYPGAADLAEFWENLIQGKDCITEIPKERWDYSLYYDEDSTKPGTISSKWGGFIDDVDKFDASFFNISPLEAEILDPQEKLFLECAFNTIENAGYSKELLAKKGTSVDKAVGVYVGVTWEEYQLLGVQRQIIGAPVALSASPSSIANRVSYFFNLNGPSMSIDSMCSSSLTAIHLACESLKSGECSMALAGGVNLSLHPNKYFFLSQARFTSSSGRCESFGNGGDGYVPGEGVGAVLLKPLASAELSGDVIYGVIKGTAINHGGKNNGYTIPNPAAQAEVIKKAIATAGIDPRNIGYIEAHGTGTSLGDPIEIAGLSKAFKQYTHDKEFCAIGSVKSNIGHLEAAAGIAGITKALLQLKHKKLVPNLHSEVLNPEIDFGKSPFAVQQKLADWHAPMLSDGQTESPGLRLVGVSSFGAGGSNAHIIIEEHQYTQEKQPNARSEAPYLMVFSANSREDLNLVVANMLKALRSSNYQQTDLPSIAYTLQSCKIEMDVRAAFAISDMHDFIAKLEVFLSNEKDIVDCFITPPQHLDGDDQDFSVEAWGKACKQYSKDKDATTILAGWVRGTKVEWQNLYNETRPLKVSLPPYPLNRKRYWLPDVADDQGLNTRAQSNKVSLLDPLLHQNTSTVHEQKFYSQFSGKEDFCHTQCNSTVSYLPETVGVDVLFAAIRYSVPEYRDYAIEISDISWPRAFSDFSPNVGFETRVLPRDKRSFAVEIRTTEIEAKEFNPVVCRGLVSLLPNNNTQTLSSDDLKAIQTACRSHHLTASQWYEELRNASIPFAENRQWISEVYCGKSQLLALVNLSQKGTSAGNERLPLNVIDLAVQAAIGLPLAEQQKIRCEVPFHIANVQLLATAAEQIWIHVKRAKTETQNPLNIDLYHGDGTLWCKITGLKMKALSKAAAQNIGALFFRPYWQAYEKFSSSSELPTRQVYLCDPDTLLENSNAKLISESIPLRLIKVEGAELAEQYQSLTRKLFSEIKQLFKSKMKNRCLMQVVLVGEKGALMSGIQAMLKTAEIENPMLLWQVIQMEDCDARHLLSDTVVSDRLQECAMDLSHREIRYADGNKYVKSIAELKVTEGNHRDLAAPLKDSGVYLITGGTGGLGLIFAQDIVKKVKNPTLILTGRSALHKNMQQRIHDLESDGATVRYMAADIAESQDAEKLVQHVLKDHGQLNGVFHSAGVIKDSFIINKEEADFEIVFKPKVLGMVNLDRAMASVDLDFFVVFSSGVAAFGNAGQADYAAANAFMDTFAVHRNTLVANGKRKGKTLSINWPLWAKGSMRIDKQSELLMARKTGMIAMQTQTGVNALYSALLSGEHQVVVVEGYVDTIRELMLGMDEDDVQAPVKKIEENISDEALIACAERYIKNLLVTVLKIPAEEIETGTPLNEYGINSVMIIQFTQEMEVKFGSLSKTLFFEYENIAELTEYFLEAHYEQLCKLLKAAGKTETGNSPHQTTKAQETETTNRLSMVSDNSLDGRQRSKDNLLHTDIAIIGLSGRYPQAANVNELWENLKQGIDSIVEIPKQRWDFEDYYDPNANSLGKCYSKWGGFIDDIDKFDPLFFSITPLDAEYLDPQERVFLETAWHTIEDAGYNSLSLGAEKVGVFVGVMWGHYQILEYQLMGEALDQFSVVPSPSYASVANRVSYTLGLRGPSISLDTMCSSSLTAIYLACESIYQGESSMALAGGVNAIVHPGKYLQLCYGQFAARDGRCRAFGEGGSGYVPGEGVGAVLLKPLSQAEQDHDHIYGVIKGASINHGGKTNGYTVPNPNAQAELISSTLNKANIDARSISYIEAHGTGTALGDPIEIRGLTKAFRESTSDEAFCAVGSIKSNIGHLESAAGVAGLTKVLLQMQHKQLLPSIHTDVLNPNLDLQNSPFIVQRELQDWHTEYTDINGIKRAIPRRAGLSSFGAGGANAYLIIEEYEQSNFVAEAATVPQLFVLSARTEEALHTYTDSLVKFLKTQSESQELNNNQLNFSNLIYTLQVGRIGMEQRLAIVVSDLQDLLYKLQKISTKGTQIPDSFRGSLDSKKIKSNKTKPKTSPLNIDCAALAERWVTGEEIDWDSLYVERQPYRMSLPTYPFARERYWLPKAEPKSGSKLQHGSYNFCHPLLHKNTSVLGEQRFTSEFDGSESCFEAYPGGHKHLSSYAYPELVSAAIKHSLPDIKHVSFKLLELTIAQPFVITDAAEKALHIVVIAKDEQQLMFEVFSSLPQGGNVIHAQGFVQLTPTQSSVSGGDNILKAIVADCVTPKISEGEHNRLFDAWRQCGTQEIANLGSIFVSNKHLLVRTVVVSSQQNLAEMYQLHPGMLRWLTMASFALLGSQPERTELVPESSEFISYNEFHRQQDLSGAAWLLVENYTQHSDTIYSVDVVLCNEAGQACVRLTDLRFKPKLVGIKPEVQRKLLLLRPEWQEWQETSNEPLFAFDNHYVILCEPPEAIDRHRLALRNDCHVFLTSIKDTQESQSSIALAANVYTVIKDLLADTASKESLIQLVIFPTGDDADMSRALAGILKTARLECPSFRVQLVEFEHQPTESELSERLQECRKDAWMQEVRYCDEQRFNKVMREYQPQGFELLAMPWKEGGVYLISGGAGTLGLLLAKEISEQSKRATLILTGRSVLSTEQQQQLKASLSASSTLVYKPVDVTDKQAVQELINDIRQNYKGLDGIVHAAGVTKDAFIKNKTAEDLIEVIKPKITGLVNLDECSAGEDLDFFIMFSSIAGQYGNRGQADYALANAYLDNYTHTRNNLVKRGKRSGKTVSINWPLWQDGGMGNNESVRKILFEGAGLIPLQTSEAMTLLYQIISSEEPQMVVLHGELGRLQENFVAGAQREPLVIKDTGLTATDEKALLDNVIDEVKCLFESVVHLPVDKIDIEEPLETYGIDSIKIVGLDNALSKHFCELSKTVFFECRNLLELSRYLLRHHAEESKTWVGFINKSADISFAQESKLPTSEIAIPQLSSIRQDSFPQQSTVTQYKGDTIPQKQGESIAITGMSGRFPLAQNLDEYWDNLQAGRDCITELDEGRWSLDGFYHPDQDEAILLGKSYCKRGGFLQNFADFDSQFFNISPREAVNMDPQERLFMEVCWEAIEDAGYTCARLAQQHHGRVGVFAGITKAGFELYGPELWQQGETMFPRTSFPSAANRISYFFNLNGPSMPVDTMCSSSLTAIHEACEHLLNNECELAIAGGVNLYLHPVKYIELSAQRMLSTSSYCKSFGQGGDGFIPGEGVGAVLLKRMSDALRDGDNIHAKIRGTGINHGGKTNGYTVPNPTAQGDLVRNTLDKAGINARHVSYIEAHGTGTKLGDPIEITGLTNAFRKDTTETQFCAIGSVKSNAGHLEAAAGIAGLIKVVLQMKHKTLVPSLHAKKLNPNIDFAKTPFWVQQSTQPWSAPVEQSYGEQIQLPRIAGVSSFGAGGANAHVVLEEFETPAMSGSESGANEHCQKLILLSAKTHESLVMQAQRLLLCLTQPQWRDADLVNIAYTLQAGREAMEERLAFQASSLEKLKEALKAYLAGNAGNQPIMSGKVTRDPAHVQYLRANDELQSQISTYLQEHNTQPLMELWIQGVEIDWQKLYQKKPRTVSLPTYAFRKRTYWLPESIVTLNRDKPTQNAALRVRQEAQVVVTEPTTTEVKAKAEPKLKVTTEAASEGPSASKLEVILQSVHSMSEMQTATSTPPRPDNIVIKPLSEIAEKSVVAPQKQVTTELNLPDETPDTKQVVTSVNKILVHETPQVVVRQAGVSLEKLQVALVNELALKLVMEEDEIDLNANFIDMGMDSIIGVEWIRAVNDRYKTAISVTSVYDYPTVALFADYLFIELADNDVTHEHSDLSIENSQKPSSKQAYKSTPSSESHQESDSFSTSDTTENQHNKRNEISIRVSASLDYLQKLLANHLCEKLAIEEELDIDSNFIDLGLDSIVGVEWIRAINEEFSTSISVTSVYDYPTVRLFSQHLRELLEQEKESSIGDELSDLLEQVYKGEIDIDVAEQLISIES